jgi:hypothetical protein
MKNKLVLILMALFVLLLSSATLYADDNFKPFEQNSTPFNDTYQSRNDNPFSNNLRGFGGGDEDEDDFEGGGGTDPDDGCNDCNDSSVGNGVGMLLLLAFTYSTVLFVKKKKAFGNN